MEITWTTTIRTWWSVMWRTFLYFTGFFAALTVLVFAVGSFSAVARMPAASALRDPAVLTQLAGVGMLLLVVVLFAVVWLSLLTMRQGLAANALMVSAGTGQVSWLDALAVYWSWSWRNILYGLGLALASILPTMLAGGNAVILFLVNLVGFVISLGLVWLSLRQALQVNSDRATEAGLYIRG